MGSRSHTHSAGAWPTGSCRSPGSHKNKTNGNASFHCVWLCACVHAHMRVCLHACLCAPVHARVCTCACACVAQVCLHACTYVRACACVRARVCARACVGATCATQVESTQASVQTCVGLCSWRCAAPLTALCCATARQPAAVCAVCASWCRPPTTHGWASTCACTHPPAVL